jgi:hypothetical protein
MMDEKEVNLLTKSEPKIIKLADGKDYTLPIMNLTTLANMEKDMGIGGKKLSAILEDSPIQTIQLMVWALIKQNLPTITREEAGKLVDLDNIKEFSECLTILTVLSGKSN